jgi:hypothetical protein
MNPEELNKKSSPLLSIFSRTATMAETGDRRNEQFTAVQCGIPRGLFTAPRDEDWANIIRRWKLAGRAGCVTACLLSEVLRFAVGYNGYAYSV